MKSGGVFNLRPSLDINYKISAMDAYQNQMFTGDENGNIYKYQLTPDSVQVVSTDNIQIKSISKQKIDSIKCLPYVAGNLLVLSDKNLYYVDINAGMNATPISKDKVMMFTLNEYSKHHHQYEVAFVTNKKEGVIIQYQPKDGKFQQIKEKFLLPEIPVTIAFMGNFFYLAILKKNYLVINLEEKQMQPQNLIIDIGGFPMIKPTDSDEILITTTNNVGVFIGKDGQPKQKNTVQITPKSHLAISIFKPFIIILFETSILVINLVDAKLMSDIALPQPAKAITQSSQHLFIANKAEIIYLYQTPYEQQIQELLKKGSVDEAISLYQQYNQISDQAKAGQLEQLKLDCAWSLIRQMQFQQSQAYLYATNFDPRDFICLFTDCYSAIQKLEAGNDNPSKFTISVVISQYVQDNKQDQKRGNELRAQFREFLIDVLEKRRQVFTSSQHAYNIKDRLHLLTSTQCFNQNKWISIPCEQMLELIDFALIKSYIESQQFGKLKIFLSGNQIYCLSSYNELQALITQVTSNKQINEQFPGMQGISARFYESFNKIELSLQVWMSIGQDSNNQLIWEEACEETVRILKQNPEKQRIFKFILWVFKKSFKIGSKIFQTSDQVITPDQMIKFIEEAGLDPELTKKLKEKYLEVLVLEKQTEEERFHTFLAYSYIDALFAIYPKDYDRDRIDMQTNKVAQEYYKSLKKFLANPNAKYNSSSILEKKVKDSWMIEEVIELYGREKRHDEALQKLMQLQQFSWAEQYCCNYNDNLLTRLFKKYIEIYNHVQNQLVDKPTEPQINTYMQTLKQQINKFLKQYSTHSQLNPLEVLDMIPEKWILSDSGQEDGLFHFLNSVISHTLHQKRSTKAAYHLSDMDLLNVECQLAQAKQANIRITTEKKCQVCNRAIGDKVNKNLNIHLIFYIIRCLLSIQMPSQLIIRAQKIIRCAPKRRKILKNILSSEMNNYQIICLFVSSAFSLSLTITFAVNIANSLSFVLLIINSLIAFMLSLIFLMSMLQKQYMNLITMLILYLQTVLLIMVNGFYLTSSCSGQISLSLILGGQLYQMVLKDSHFQQRTHMKIVYFVSSSVLALFYIGFTNLVIAPKLENVESGIFIILVIILQIKTSVDLDREDSKSTDALHFKEKPQDHNKIVFSQYFDHPKSRAELLSQRDLGFNKIVISKSIKIDQSLLYESLEFFNEGLVILQESDYQKRQLPFDITYMNQANKALFGVKDSVEMIEYLEQLKNLQVSLQDSDEIMEKRRDSKNSREQQFNKMARSINMVRMLEVSTVKQFDQVMVEDKISTVSMTELIMRLKRQGSSQQVFMRCFLNTDNQERMLEFVVKYEPKDKFVIIISRDVTHRQKIKYLKEYDLQKSKFLSFVSHEYRTPLNSIITMLETVLPTTVGEQKQWLQTALENTQYILNLSNDLLDLAQIKSGKFKMQQTKINLEELCKECLNMFTLSAYIKNIELECCYDEESPKVILADKNRIKQILVNLLSNAFKFTKNGKIKILVSQKNQNVLRVGVKDNGIGISESDQKLLFKAFAKVNSEESSKLNNTGVGLGLMICNQIAQQLGPNSQGIQIESNKGQGSYFYFEFDLIYHLTQKPSSIKLREVKIIDQQEYYQPPTEQKITTEINCKCNRILVVDDEQFNLTVFKLKLNKMGVEDVDYALSGQEAIEKVENSRCGIPCYAYKLIFMDLMMPKMSGLQTASQIIKSKPNQVIIACSGHSEQSEKKECSLAGIKDYLEKPIKDDNLKTILQTYL